MAGSSVDRRAALAPPKETLENELERIASSSIDILRKLWQEIYGASPPQALSKDLLARALSYGLQEQRLGGLERRVRKLLAGVGKSRSTASRRVKVGSVVVREYQGVVHDVMVVPDGFYWRGETYSSLSTIARKITGTNWNGPRFFGISAKTGERAS